MSLALRQIALVAARLAPVEHALTTVFDLTPCHRDPAVGQYGLENVLLAIGRQFLEVVAPTRDETAAGRFLARRGGDGGYMVITQCADHDVYRARVAALGVRIAHEFQAEGFRNMQLHPRDTGGSFFEIDQQLGDAENWLPAGEHWRDTPASTFTPDPVVLNGGSALVQWKKIGNQIQLIAKNTEFHAKPGTPQAQFVSTVLRDTELHGVRIPARSRVMRPSRSTT